MSQQEQTKVNFLLVEGTGNEEKPLKIPKEVWLLVNRLFTQSCQQVTLWTKPYPLILFIFYQFFFFYLSIILTGTLSVPCV